MKLHSTFFVFFLAILEEIVALECNLCQEIQVTDEPTIGDCSKQAWTSVNCTDSQLCVFSDIIVGSQRSIGRGCSLPEICQELKNASRVENQKDFFCITCETDLCNGDTSFRVVAIWLFLTLTAIAAGGVLLCFTGQYVVKLLRKLLS